MNRYFSFGGGVQSTAVLCLVADGKLKYDAMVFANVGDDSENPRTLEYIRDYARPFAEEHGIELIEVQKRNRAGEIQTLKQRIMTTPRSVPIPAWLPSGAFGNRVCTSDFKIGVVARWTKQHGATKDDPATIGLGISLDEFTRAKDSRIQHHIHEFPLLDQSITRQDCRKIITDHGLPIPPKSSCYFCPFHKPLEWQRIKREEPELFDKAVEIDHHIRDKRNEHGKKGIYLHVSRHPLDVAVGYQYAMDLQEDDLPCDTGYCFL